MIYFHSSVRARLLDLPEKLNWTESTGQEVSGFFFLEEAGQLALKDLSQPQLSPLSVNFADPSFLMRVSNPKTKNALLYKAIGAKSGVTQVCDATAGLGTDAMIMASLGSQVFAFERNPVVYLLLRDGLDRALLDSRTQRIAGKIKLENAAAELGARQSGEPAGGDFEKPECIYLDPMYPENPKSALPKRGMQFLRSIVSEEQNAEALLRWALERASRRVVLKRPLKRAEALPAKPSFSVEGKTHEYLVFLR